MLADGDEVLCFGVVDKRLASSAEILWAAFSAPHRVARSRGGPGGGGVATGGVGSTLAKEGDLELLAQEQVLEEEALAAAQGVDERGQEELEEFDHPKQDRAP